MTSQNGRQVKNEGERVCECVVKMLRWFRIVDSVVAIGDESNSLMNVSE